MSDASQGCCDDQVDSIGEELGAWARSQHIVMCPDALIHLQVHTVHYGL